MTPRNLLGRTSGNLTGEFHKWTHLEDDYGGSGRPGGEVKASLTVLCSGNTHYGILGSSEK